MKKVMLSTLLVLSISIGVLFAQSYQDDLYGSRQNAREKQNQKISATQAEKLVSTNNSANVVNYNEPATEELENQELVTTYDGALSKRLMAYRSDVNVPEEYWDMQEKYVEILGRKYDQELYSIVVINDHAWVEPRYITSMFEENVEPIGNLEKFTLNNPAIAPTINYNINITDPDYEYWTYYRQLSLQGYWGPSWRLSGGFAWGGHFSSYWGGYYNPYAGYGYGYGGYRYYFDSRWFWPGWLSWNYGYGNGWGWGGNYWGGYPYYGWGNGWGHHHHNDYYNGRQVYDARYARGNGYTRDNRYTRVRDGERNPATGTVANNGNRVRTREVSSYDRPNVVRRTTNDRADRYNPNGNRSREVVANTDRQATERLRTIRREARNTNITRDLNDGSTVSSRQRHPFSSLERQMDRTVNRDRGTVNNRGNLNRSVNTDQTRRSVNNQTTPVRNNNRTQVKDNSRSTNDRTVVRTNTNNTRSRDSGGGNSGGGSGGDNSGGGGGKRTR